MSFEIVGLDPSPFSSLYGLSDDALAARGARRAVADRSPGFPCRITLEDAPAGASVILLHHVSHDVQSPYRSAYAVFVREGAQASARFRDAIPPVLQQRPIALRCFTARGDLVGASLAKARMRCARRSTRLSPTTLSPISTPIMRRMAASPRKSAAPEAASPTPIHCCAAMIASPTLLFRF